MAQQVGLAANNGSRSATAFDLETGTVRGTVAVPGGVVVGDVAITRDGTLGFVTDFRNRVWAIDLQGPPALAPGVNPTPISNHGEDLALTPDGRFLLVTDGTLREPVSVIDVATRTEVATADISGWDHDAVDVCDDGVSVLVTSVVRRRVYRAVLDGTGRLTPTGESMALPDVPYNVYCAPGSASGVVMTGSAGWLGSFLVPGLVPVDGRNLGGFGVSGVFAADGRRFLARVSSPGGVLAFDVDPATGALGAAPALTFPVANAVLAFGMDQMALSSRDHRLFVTEGSFLRVYDSITGLLQRSTGGFFGATGIAVPGQADTTPPVLTLAPPASLWPPSHRLVRLAVEDLVVSVADDVDGSIPVSEVRVTSIASDEQDNATGVGDGSTLGDAVLALPCHAVQLRAERSARGNGRVYTITLAVADRAGNVGSALYRVSVPRHAGGYAVEDVAAVVVECPAR